MKRYCCFLNFGSGEVQNVTTFVVSSNNCYSGKEEALKDFSNSLFNIYKNEVRESQFRKWFNDLPKEEADKVRKNYNKCKEEFSPNLSEFDFASWLYGLPNHSFAGLYPIGDVADPYILGWEIRTDLLNLMKNKENLEFIEIESGAENKILSFVFPYSETDDLEYGIL